MTKAESLWKLETLNSCLESACQRDKEAAAFHSSPQEPLVKVPGVGLESPDVSGIP